MYKLLLNSTSVLRLSESAVVPADERNGDWRDYQAWLVAGNTPEPADPAPALTKDQRISELLKPIGLTQAWQLDGFMAGMLGGAATQGITEAQLLLVNPAYKMANAIRTQILAIQAEP